MNDSYYEQEPRASTSGSRVSRVAHMGMHGVPPGLAYLANQNSIVIKQQVELGEMILGCECSNQYMIKDQFGRDVFQAKEDSCCMTRQCCGTRRCFDMKITDFAGMEVMHLRRPLRCEHCCCFCCLQKMDVFAPPGELIGRVKKSCSLCTPNYVVKDAMGEVVLKIKGPCNTTSCCGSDVQFKVLTADGSHEVGKISKKWGGVFTEAFSDADIFGISFPMDLDVRMKATLIGACILIDYMYFESTPHNENR